MSQYPSHYPQSGAPAAAPARPNIAASALQVVGGVVAVISAFLAWVSISGNGLTVSISGMGTLSGLPDGTPAPDLGVTDGGLAIAAGALAIVGGALLLALKKSALSVIAIIGGLGGLIIGIRDLSDINSALDQVGSSGVSGSVGIGIWLLIVGSAVALIGGVLGLVTGRRKV